MTASSAVFAGRTHTLYEVADSLPCADFGLLAPLKRSPEYAAIRRRVADPKPVDAWQMDMLHYFLFPLPAVKEPANGEAPYALFTMRWEDNGPVSALVITPHADGKQAEVVDLRQPGTVSTVPLSQE